MSNSLLFAWPFVYDFNLPENGCKVTPFFTAIDLPDLNSDKSLQLTFPYVKKTLDSAKHLVEIGSRV